MRQAFDLRANIHRLIDTDPVSVAQRRRDLRQQPSLRARHAADDAARPQIIEIALARRPRQFEASLMQAPLDIGLAPPGHSGMAIAVQPFLEGNCGRARLACADRLMAARRQQPPR